MRPLKLGLFLPMFEPFPGGPVDETLRWPEMLALVRRAEAVGFDSVWVPDHLLRQEVDHGPRYGVWEAWSVLAALAGATERIALGTLVLSTAFRNPALLAKMADTVDEVSGGRLILGVGAGGHEPDFRAFGFPLDHRASRFEEALVIVTTLLREGRIDFAGRYVSARDCELRPRAARSGGPPILVAARGPRMQRLTAEHADLANHWLVFGRSDPAAVPPLREQLDVACRQVDRDPTTLLRTVSITVVPSGQAPPPLMPTAVPVRGSADQIASIMRAFAREGIAHLQLALYPCTEAAVEAMAPVLALLDRVGPEVPDVDVQ